MRGGHHRGGSEVREDLNTPTGKTGGELWL